MKHSLCAMILAAGLLALVALNGCVSAPDTLPLWSAGSAQGTLEASGTIEAEEITVSAEAAGRVVEIAVQEGDTVTAGQLLLRLDSEAIEAQRDGAQAAVLQARAGLASARAQLEMARNGARAEEISAARSAVAAAEAELRAARVAGRAAAQRVAQAEAAMAAAEGQVASAEAGLDLARAQRAAAAAVLKQARAGATAEERGIIERGVEAAKNALWGDQARRDAICGNVGRGVSQADCDGAQAAAQASEEAVRIAELRLVQVLRGTREEEIEALVAQLAQADAGVASAEAGLSTARANRDAAAVSISLAKIDLETAPTAAEAAAAQRDGLQAQLDLVLAGARTEELEQAEAQAAGAEAGVDAALAVITGIDIQLGKSRVAAPANGIVLDRLINLGELAAHGTPLFTLADLTDLRLTLYIPEAELGRVRLNQSLEVSVDSYRETFKGKVMRIARQAEFTPKNVETREERVNMVFAVEIALEDSAGRLLPGMPADAAFKE